MNTAEVIDTLAKAGLDYHDFKVGIIADTMSRATETTFWEAASDYARTDRGYYGACKVGGIIPDEDPA